MVSRDELVLITSKYEGNNETIIDINKCLKQNVIFVIKEYDDAFLINKSINYDIFIEDLDEGKEKLIAYDEKVTLNSNDHPFPPLEYRIRIVDKATKKSYLKLYKIVQSLISDDRQYKRMISSICQYDENLLYDDRVLYLNKNRISQASYRSFYVTIANILTHKSVIYYSLNSLYLNPLKKDKKIASLDNKIKKQNARTIVKNSRLMKSDVYFNAKMIQYTDFSLNRYLLYMLIYSRIKLNELKEKVVLEKEAIISRLNKILAKSSSDASLRKAHTNYQIDALSKKQSLLNECLDTFKYIDGYINKIVNSEAFIDVKPSNIRVNSIIHHPTYLNIERHLYLPLYQTSILGLNQSLNSLLSSSLKQTSKLFEAYCLLTLDSSLTELGFEYIDEDIDYAHYVKRYRKDDYIFELSYNIEAKDVSIVKRNEIYYLNENMHHTTPDFFLTLKKGDMSVLFLVLDAKCRKIHYVEQDIENGKYERTIRDYLSFRYCNDDNPFFMPKIVDALFLLFPSSNSSYVNSKHHQLEYHFLELELDGQEDKFISSFNDYLLMYLD